MGNFNKLFNSKNPMKISGNTGNGTTYSSAAHGPLAYSPLKQMEEETAPVEPVEGEQGEQPGIAGQDTGEVTTESDGTKYVTSEYDVKGGAKIIENINRSLDYYGVKKGFIITKINKKPVLTAAEAKRVIDNSFGNGNPIYLELINLKGEIERYAIR